MYTEWEVGWVGWVMGRQICNELLCNYRHVLDQADLLASAFC